MTPRAGGFTKAGVERTTGTGAFGPRSPEGEERRDGDVEDEWDTIWDARARITEQGWTAEVAIPFKSLRFKPTEHVWGLNIERLIKRHEETVRWANARNDAWVTNLTEAGHLQGMVGLEQGLGLDIRPFLSGGEVDRDGTFKAGVDVVKSLTPNLTASVTVNTDFAETEVDSRQINLTRFPLFFPEKRTFFLEGAGVYDVAGLGGSVGKGRRRTSCRSSAAPWGCAVAVARRCRDRQRMGPAPGPTLRPHLRPGRGQAPVHVPTVIDWPVHPLRSPSAGRPAGRGDTARAHSDCCPHDHGRRGGVHRVAGVSGSARGDRGSRRTSTTRRRCRPRRALGGIRYGADGRDRTRVRDRSSGPTSCQHFAGQRRRPMRLLPTTGPDGSALRRLQPSTSCGQVSSPRESRSRPACTGPLTLDGAEFRPASAAPPRTCAARSKSSVWYDPEAASSSSGLGASSLTPRPSSRVERAPR